jgi:hypothetical protein
LLLDYEGKKYSLSKTGIADETAVFVDKPRNYTAHFKGGLKRYKAQPVNAV